jgi:hypothetical protein
VRSVPKSSAARRRREAIRAFWDEVWESVIPPFDEYVLKHLRESRESVPRRLLHFTDMAGVAGIVNAKTLRLTRAKASNDSREMLYGLDVGRRCLEAMPGSDDWIRIFKEEVSGCWDGKPFFGAVKQLPDPHICCFSVSSGKNERSIPHWAMYAKSGAGAALALAGRRLANRSNVDLVRVVYDRRRQERMMTAALNRGLQACVEGRRKASVHGARAAESIFRTLAHAVGSFASMPAAIMKDPDFRFEDEWRLIVSYLPVEPTPEEAKKQLSFSAFASGEILKSCYLLPIEPEDLKAIIVGPAAAGFNEPVIRMLLSYNGFEKHTEVRVGTTALRGRPG